jgi:hypothetical protein
LSSAPVVAVWLAFWITTTSIGERIWSELNRHQLGNPTLYPFPLPALVPFKPDVVGLSGGMVGDGADHPQMKAWTDSGARGVAMSAGVPEDGRFIPGQAAEGSSPRAPEPWCGHGPTSLPTWTEHGASLDSACPQLGGGTWPLSMD